jgi:hypothetical protein
VPDPTVPGGYVSAYQPVIYAAPGPISTAVYQRTWAPPGTFSPTKGASGPYIELRVQAHQPDGPLFIGPGLGAFVNYVTLANGAKAEEAGNVTNSQVNGITWSHAGLDYDLQTNGISSQQLLAVANSLP